MKKGNKINYICTTRRKNGVGELSSKYAYDRDGKQFEADVQRHIEKSNKLYAEFVEWMENHGVTSNILGGLFRCYYEEFVERAPIESPIEREEELYTKFYGWIKNKGVNPRKYRGMFLHYYEELSEKEKEAQNA